MSYPILKKEFFERSTVRVARELLGKYLVRRTHGKTHAFMITEVEVYDGFADQASHAAKGQTVRNRPMYGEAGVWYVYLIYGMYEMLNIVTRESGYPAAILIRGVNGISGPGKLTRALAVSRMLNSKPAKKSSGLWIEDRGVIVSSRQIRRTPRVGVSYAGELWSQKPWRFIFQTDI